MTIEVEIAGTNQIAEFPDGTPPEVIQQALAGAQQPAEQGLGGQLIGAADIAGFAGTELLKEGVKGLSTVGGLLTPGRDPQQAVQSAEALKAALPSFQLGEEGQRLITTLSERFKDSPEIVQELFNAASTLGPSIAESTFQATEGLPPQVRGALAAAAGAIPGALEAVAGVRAPRALSEIPELAATKAGGRAEDLTSEAADVTARFDAPVTDEAIEATVSTIVKGDETELIEAVRADPAFYQAADELGLNTEPLASFASQNPQFRALEQGLASIPTSQLDAQSKAFIGELSQKADDIIQEYGGTLDKAALSDRFREASLKTIDDLGEQADAVYEQLGKAIPPSTRVDSINISKFIDQKTSELGGFKELPPLLKRLDRSLRARTRKGKPVIDPVLGARVSATTIKPTNEKLNQLRREVGQAINKRSGAFKDSETGLLKQVYKRLKLDQDAAAEVAGVSSVSRAADALVRQRKQIEDNTASLLGKDLSGSLLPKVGQALKRLSKGDVRKFDELIERIPKNFRQEVVLSSLNDIFRGGGANQKSLSATQFTNFMNDLNRSPATKARLMRELPAESRRAIDNLATISKGISVALGDKIPTGRIAAFFDDNNGFMSRMMGGVITGAAAIKGGPLLGSAVREFMNQTTNGSKAASELMGSPRFQNIIRGAVRDGVTEGAQVTNKLRAAEKQLAKSKQFKRWADTLNESESARLASLGVAAYLLSPSGENNNGI